MLVEAAPHSRCSNILPRDGTAYASTYRANNDLNLAACITVIFMQGKRIYTHSFEHNYIKAGSRGTSAVMSMCILSTLQYKYKMKNQIFQIAFNAKLCSWWTSQNEYLTPELFGSCCLITNEWLRGSFWMLYAEEWHSTKRPYSTVAVHHYRAKYHFGIQLLKVPFSGIRSGTSQKSQTHSRLGL